MKASERCHFIQLSELTSDVRTGHVLNELGIKFVGQLVLLTERDLLRAKNCGRKTVEGIKKILGSLGAKLGSQEPTWGRLDAEDIANEFANEISEAASWVAHQRRPKHIRYLEDEIEQLLEDIPNTRNRDIFVSRFGLNGNKQQTLADVANDFGGVTRERIRQIVVKCSRRISQKSWHLPALEKAINLILNLVPCSDEQIQNEMRIQNISRNSFSVSAIIELAKIFRKKMPIKRAYGKLSNLWVFKGQEYIAQHTKVAARKTLSSVGVATFTFIADEIKRKDGVNVSKDFVYEIVKREPAFQIIDDKAGWFWFRTNRNRLVNVLRKIFSITHRAHVSEVRLAIQRFRRLKGFAPPQRVLLNLCEVLPEFEVNDSFIFRAEGVSSEGWITGAESIFVSVLRENGGVLDRIRLEEECVKKGMNRNTFAIYLSASPVMLKLGRGVFGLVGADATANQIAALELKRARFKAVSDHYWAQNGQLRIEYRVTQNMLYTGFFPVPGPISDYIVGSFILVNSDGEQLGKITTKKGIGWNLKGLFRSMGGDEGDEFALTFDLIGKKVVIQFGQQLSN